MAPKFCCCLPLRLGVLLISLFQFGLCGLAAGGFWYVLWLAKQDDTVSQSLQGSARTAFIVAGAIYTVAAIVGLFGFLGAIFKKNGLVRTYLGLLYVVLFLQIASGIYSLVMFYRFRHDIDAREDCINGSTDPTRINYCDSLQKFYKLPTWSIWVASIVPMFVVSYACYVVHNYSRRLVMQKAEAARETAHYVPVSKHDDVHQPLTTGSYIYPYADAPHSFGNTAGHPPDYHNKV